MAGSSLFLLSTLFLLFVSLFPFVRSEDFDESDVTVLTESNFDQFINQDLVLVEFYAPWCGHCKALAPEYAKAATELKALGIPLGKVDATVENKVAGRFSISGYPTLKIFRNGRDSEYKAGMNGRKAPGIVAYMKKQKRPAVTILESEVDVNTFIVSDSATNFAVVGFFSSEKTSQLQSSFALLATKLRDDFFFGKVTDKPELLQKYTKDSAVEGLVVFSYGEPIVYTGAAKQSQVEEFIRSKSIPLVGLFTDDNAELYNNRGLPIANFVMKVDKNFNSKHMKYFTNRFKKIAEAHKDELVVAVADRGSQKYLVDNYNLQDEEISLVIEDKDRKWRYEAESDSKVGKMDVEGWTKWVKEVLDGDVEQYVRSERAPKNNNGPVKIVTGKNFDEIVNDPSKDVMIEFYAPWCGHCKALEPKYNELGGKFKGQDSVVIAKIDATANDFDREKWKVSGYPTIFFRPAAASGSSKLPAAELYEGAREVDAMQSFIKKNARSLKKKGKKAKKAKKDDDDDDE